MIRFCSGVYLHRWYLIPTIELDKFEKRRFYLCLSFLKLYIGICVDMQEEDE